MSSDESDGSFEDDAVARRRPVRAGRAKISYAGMGGSSRYDEEDSDDSNDKPRKKTSKAKQSEEEEDDDSDQSQSQAEEEPQMEIETLVARRNGETGDLTSKVGPFDFLVKWKDLSYLHAEWISEPDLLFLGGRGMQTRISRFNNSVEKGKKLAMIAPVVEKEEGDDDVTAKIENWSNIGQAFDPALTEIEKVVAMRAIIDAIAPPPAPLPDDESADATDKPSVTSTPEPVADANGDTGKTTPDLASVNAVRPLPVKSTPLAEDDIVPNTSMTLAELRLAHEIYEYPPHRQELYVRGIKGSINSAKEAEAKIAAAKQSFEARAGPFRASLELAKKQGDADVEARLAAQISAFLSAYEAEVMPLQQQVDSILANGASKVKFAPRDCYLVKWKGGSYKTMTWEWAEDIDDDLKIALFKRIETPPTGVKPVGSRQLQGLNQKRRRPDEGLSVVAPIPEKKRRDAELDLLRFRRAAETLPVLQVPEALLPYALQLEVSGLVQREDEIICVNGLQCTGLRTEEINKMIKENTGAVRVLRFLRRETGHELEIKFDPQKKMGFVMDELKQDNQPSQTKSWAAHMGQRRQVSVEYSARIKKFPTPDDYTRGNKPAPPDFVNAAVRSAVLAVFSAREALSPLTLPKWSSECGVDVGFLHNWLLKSVPYDEQLISNEETFRLWLARCAHAFSCSPSVDIATIEASLILNNPNGLSLPPGRDSDDLDPARAYAKSLLNTAQNELLGTELRFEAESRRQKADFSAWMLSGEAGAIKEEIAQSLASVTAEGAEEQVPMEEPEEYYDEYDSGTSLHQQQLRRIQLLQSAAKMFVPYGPTNMPRFKNSNTLREYQLQGVNWLIKQFYEGRNCILADEMGLGKTVQVVAFLEHLRAREQLRGPFLIIAPLSTMGHWRREFENWTDANVCYYYDGAGGAKGRELIRKYEWFYEQLNFRPDVCKFNVLLTTYETYIADVDDLSQLPFINLVIDEGHRLKSQSAKLLQDLRRITAPHHRLLLSGTPLQNNLHELWSLLNFCDQNRFPSSEAFLRRHAQLLTHNDILRLQQEIAPYMLRRVKEDVEKSIPPKEETIVDVELTLLQKKYYRAIFERNREFLYKGIKGNNRPQLINVEIELRKCCNHPFLISGVRDKEMEELRQRFDFENANLAIKERQRKWSQSQLDRLIQSSGKLVLVDKLLAKLKSEGRKVLIFSQMVRMLDLLGEFFSYRGYVFERLDGSVQGNTRQAAIDRFSKPNSDSFVFLLSTRAGGVGINLTAADTVIIFDSDWNPQNDAQAQARCHRIGQDKPVTIYRLVTKNSYEETMLDRAAKKLGLEQAVLGAGTTGQSGKELKPEELEKMLRLGAYHHLQPSATDDEESRNFMNLDIESLLRTRTRKIKVDGIRGTVSLELTHNTTNDQPAEEGEDGEKKAKQTVVNSHGEDVDVNDPDFWTKMLPKEETEQSLLFKLGESSGISELRQSPEARFKFVKRVREIVEEVLTLRERGEVIDYTRMDSIIALLVQMSALQNVFGRDHCDAASKWRQAIEASRERKSRQKAKEMQGGYDERKLFGDIDEEEKAPLIQASTTSRSRAGTDKVASSSSSSTATKEQPWGFQSCHGCYDSTGSDLYSCHGKCKRAFHPGCYKVGSSSFDTCDECAVGGKCMVCDQVSRESLPGNPWEPSLVKKCAKVDCGRFFHKTCLKKVDEKLVTMGIKGGDPDDFFCPAHRCCKCHRGDGPVAGPVNLQCIRCYKGFHTGCMNPTHTKRASRNLVVCPDHFKGRIFPVSEHLKYGELMKKKPVPKAAEPQAKRLKEADDEDDPDAKKKKKPNGTGAAIPPKPKVVKTSLDTTKPASGNALATKKVAPIKLKLSKSPQPTGDTAD